MPPLTVEGAEAIHRTHHQVLHYYVSLRPKPMVLLHPTRVPRRHTGIPY